MEHLSQIIFIILLGVSTFFFVRNVGKIRRNIMLGKPQDLSDNKKQRWLTMLKVAFGQSKMTVRPVAAFFHFLIYAGFILINIEVLEIILDGILGTHRIFMEYLGTLYYVAINFFELLAALVFIACVVFLFRRYVLRLGRFTSPELRGFPNRDAATILFIEITLMLALLILDSVDPSLCGCAGNDAIVSGLISPLFDGLSPESKATVEHTAWWFHIIGIFLFMNYLPFSKHFHIILAFPNTYYSNLNPMGKFTNMDSVTTEVKLMLDPATPPEGYVPPVSFGVKDVKDLSWKNLLDAYTCTECGRCTSVCPANITGKLLSPRKIMMDTRDRLEEVGRNMDKNGADHDDGKNLHTYISEEELWACTTCNACAEACPVNINPVEIIVEMRRYKVMEQSSAPSELNGMFNNLENNQAPWQFSPSDRGNWAKEG